MTCERTDTLPSNIVPTHYSLCLRPDLERAVFEGSLSVTVKVLEDTDTVVMNAAELEIKSAELAGGIKPVACLTDQEKETLTLRFAEPLKAGTVTHLVLVFTGTLNDRMAGFYLSKYRDPDGTERRLAATQFEAGNARRCFPCWDEPALKATFDVGLLVPRGLIALSNGQPLETILDREPGRVLTIYAQTPRMSTYLLACVVGDLRSASGQTVDGKPITVWTTPGKETNGRFAIETARAGLAFYEEYFGIKYPLPKLDMVALPDFAFGAMENWGLITYRENALLVDEAKSSEVVRRRVAEVVLHELAHQWFGNLVTMRWWDNLWLNESFATWLAYKSMDGFRPEWHVWEHYVADETSSAMGLDALDNTHPIEVPVPSVKQVDEIFDAISYEKGGSVLRMLEAYVGPEKFRLGLQLYMRNHAYGNAESADLWSAIAEACPPELRVSEIMSSWTKTTGFPVVKVRCRADRNEAWVWLKQERYRQAGTAPNDNVSWRVPLNIAIEDHGQMSHLLTTGDEELAVIVRFDFAIAENPDRPIPWLNANAGRTGFYRVAYDAENAARLAQAVARGGMPKVEDRFGLLDDAGALAISGGPAEVMSFLNLVASYRHETNYSVWSGLLGGIGSIAGLVSDQDEVREAMRRFRLELVRDAAHAIGWDARTEDRPDDALLRGLLIRQAGWCGDDSINAESARRFADLQNGGTADPNLLGAIYGLTVRYGGETGFEAILARYRATDIAEEKNRLLGALAGCQTADHIRRLIDFLLSDEVRKQDRPSFMGSLAGNRLATRLVWETVKANWQRLTDDYRGNSMMLAGFARCAGALTTPADLEDATAFFRDHPAEGLTRTVAQTLESLRLDIAWRERNLQAVGEWLAKR